MPIALFIFLILSKNKYSFPIILKRAIKYTSKNQGIFFCFVLSDTDNSCCVNWRSNFGLQTGGWKHIPLGLLYLLASLLIICYTEDASLIIDVPVGGLFFGSIINANRAETQRLAHPLMWISKPSRILDS